LRYATLEKVIILATFMNRLPLPERPFG